MVSLGYKHIYFGDDKVTLSIALGQVLRLSAHNFHNLIIMPRDLGIQQFIHNHIKNTSVIFYNTIDLMKLQKQFFEKHNVVFFLSLRPENLNILLPLFEELKEKEIIVTSRKFNDAFTEKFDYVTGVTRQSNLNSNKVIVYTGDGKGKTTGAIGRALIERMRGKKAFIFHFLKNKASITEDKGLIKIDRFELIRLGRDEPDYAWITGKGPDKKDIELAKEGLRLVRERISLFKNSLVVLDEILFAIRQNLIDEKEVVKIISEKPQETILLLTGRGENQYIFRNASQIFTMKKIKHPYDNEVSARKGIEY